MNTKKTTNKTNETLKLLVGGLMLVAAVGCANAPKENEAPKEPIASMTPVEEPVVEQAPETQSPSSSSTTTDYNLGAGSSGRGH